MSKAKALYAFKVRVGALVVESGQRYADSGVSDEEVAAFYRDLAAEVVLCSAYMHKDQNRSAADFRQTAENAQAIAWGKP